MSLAKPLNSPVTRYGGKFKLAPRLVAMMPPHLHYVEPYAGALHVLFAKPASLFEGHSEVVNDLDGHLTNFWEVMRDEILFPAFCRQAEAIPFSESEFQAALVRIGRTADPVVRAVSWFVLVRQSFTANCKNFQMPDRQGRPRSVNAWWSAIDRLPAVYNRLRRVLIFNRDAIHCIEGQDGEQTFFLVDPPYLHETREDAAVYDHEMTATQHCDLLDCLANVNGKFLLCGYPSYLYDQAAEEHGWRRFEFDVVLHGASTPKVGGKKPRRTEVAWANYDPPRTSQGGLF